MAEEGRKKDPEEKEPEQEAKGVGKAQEEGGESQTGEGDPAEQEPEGGEQDPGEEAEPEEGAEESKEGVDGAPSLEELLKNPELRAAFDEKVQEALQEKLEAKEAERLAGMTPEERVDYEADKKAQELLEREKALAARERKAAAMEELAAEQLPAALAECFSYESDESWKNTKELVVKAFQKAVSEAVETRLRRPGAPKASGEGAKRRMKKGAFAEAVRSQRSRR